MSDGDAADRLPDGRPTDPRGEGHFPSPFTAVALTFAAILATAFVVVLQSSMTNGKPDYGSIGIGTALGFGCIASLAARAVPAPQPERIGLVGFAASWWPTLLLLLPMVLLTSEIDNWITTLTPAEDQAAIRERIEQLIGRESWTSWAQIAIVTIGLTPVVEEFLFRGVIQQGLIAYLGRGGGVLFTSLLFGLSHIDVSRPEPVFVGAVVMGLVLGLVRIASGSLLAVILLHAAWNTIAFAAQLGAEQYPIAGFNAPGDQTTLTLLLPAALAVGLAMSWLTRALPAVPVALPVPPPDPRQDDDDDGGWPGF